MGIIFGIFSFYTHYSDTRSNENKSFLLNIATELSETIIEVRELLPTNVAYDKCINESKRNTYDKKFEDCMLSIKQHSEEASVNLKKVIAKFQPLVTKQDYASLMSIYKKIDYTIYEIENNQFIIGKWEANGCSETIDIKCGNEVNSLTKKFFDSNKGCMLSVESYDGFLDRSKTNNDIISSVKDSTITRDKLKCFIVPGSSNTIKEYFHDMNNQLVKNYILYTDELNNIVKSVISKS